MSTFTQTGRPLVLETPLGKDVLLLTSLSGVEGISRPFQFTLETLNEPSNVVAFAQLLGQPVTVTVTMPGAPIRYVNGVVTSLVQGRQVTASDGSTTFIRHRLEIAPRFGMLRKRIQNRIFQQLTVPAILAQVLDGLGVRFAITGQYAPRDYCVQYRESDFAFASRLMEEEGICYYFEHGKDSHTMVVTDAQATFAKLPGQNQLTYATAETGSANDRRVRDWEKRQDVASSHYSTRDHCFELQEHNLEYQHSMAGTVVVGTVTHPLAIDSAKGLSIDEYPGRFAQRFDGISAQGQAQAEALAKVFDDGPRTARMRIEQEAAESLRIRGAGDYAHMVPGYLFTLERHFNGDGDYLLTQVEHVASIEESYLGGGGTRAVYSNHFECLPRGLTYRPQRTTPAPTIQGPQSATVVGPAGEQVFCDKYGRVKVQFRWDRQGKNDTNSSCWLRVAQPWAGQGFGSVHLPRVGQEVVVAFEEGDPDRPIIIGSVYNSTNPPPFPLPDKAAQTGFKSSTLHGAAANFSGLGFDDTPGYEHVQLHSERHQTQSAEENLFVNVGQEHHVSIGKMHTRQVGSLPGVNTFLSHPGPSGGGSGSGGGSASAASSDFNWDCVIGGKLGDALAKDTSLTLGYKATNNVGATTSFTLGWTANNYWNPAAILGPLLAKVPVLGEKATPTMLGAYSAVYMGGRTVFCYGNHNSIHRGTRLDATGESSLLMKTLAGVYLLSETCDALLPAIAPLNRSSGESAAVESAGFLLSQFILSLWTMVELDENKITVLTPLGAYARLYGDLTISFPYLLAAAGTGVPRAVDVYAELSGYLKPQGVTGLRGLVAHLSSVAPDSEAFAGITAEQAEGLRVHTASSTYCIAAPAICLFGRSTTVPPLAASIIVQTDARGCMSLLSGAATTIGCGINTLIALKSTVDGGTMTLDCSGAGSLTLQTGPEVKVNKVELSPTTGITLASSVDVNKIEMNDVGIKVASTTLGLQMMAGEYGISINPETGVTIAVGDVYLSIAPDQIAMVCGASMLSLTADGITMAGTTIKMNGDTKSTTVAPQVVIQ